MLGLLVFFFAIDFANAFYTRAKMYAAVRTAALASALALIDDRSLIGDQNESISRKEFARHTAEEYAYQNGLHRPTLPTRTGNTYQLKVEFSSPDVFQSRSGGPSAQEAVEVVGSQGISGLPLILPQLFSGEDWQLCVSSVVLLDREILGFRPIDSRKIPLLPIAIASDPQSQSSGSWEDLIMRSNQDDFAFDPVDHRFVHGTKDRLPEITLELMRNAAPLLLTRVIDLSEQVEKGLKPSDLEELGGVLIPSNPDCVIKTLSEVEFARTKRHLIQSLELVCMSADVRIWPLVKKEHLFGGKSVTISDFVAARIVNIDAGSTLRITIQPACLSVPTALTKLDLSPNGAIASGAGHFNPFMAKVRFIR